MDAARCSLTWIVISNWAPSSCPAPQAEALEPHSSCCKYQWKRSDAHSSSLSFFTPESHNLLSSGGAAQWPKPRAHLLLQPLRASLRKRAGYVAKVLPCSLTHAPVQHGADDSAKQHTSVATLPSSPPFFLCSPPTEPPPARLFPRSTATNSTQPLSLIWFEHQKQLLGSFATHSRGQAGPGIPPLLC